MAERLIGLGWQVVPEVAKRPVMTGWQTPRSAAWWLRELRHNRQRLSTGVVTNDIVALDLDVENATISHELMCLAFDMLGSTPVRCGRAPRLLMPFRVDSPIRSSAWRFELNEVEHAVEVKGEGAKFSAIGLHARTGRPYAWDTPPLEIPRANLPVVTWEMLQLYHWKAAGMVVDYGGTILKTPRGERTARPRRASLRRPPVDEVASKLRRIPNDGDGQPYDTWIRVAYALKGTLGPEAGEPLWLWWSGQSDKDQPAVTADVWLKIEPQYSSYRSLVCLARELS